MKNSIKTQLAYWLPAYAWAVLIFYFSSGSLTGSVVSSSNVALKISDYYKHLIAYSFFTFLLWRAYRHSRFKHAELFAIVTASFYGMGNELNQYFIPGRNFSLIDILFDFIGCVLAQPLVSLYKNFKKR